MKHLRIPSLALAALLPLCFLPPARAQDQGAIQAAFLNHTVWLKIAMPGTQLGIDIFPERPNPMPSNYDSLLSQYPAAYRPGDSATVTKINFKKDHIEFQLDHGGFGVFGDNDDISPVPFHPLPPSRDENDLRNRIDHEGGRDRDDDQHRLDFLIHQREDADRRNRESADNATAAKINIVAAARAHGGSRFNITYAGRVPENLTPVDVAHALDPFLSFTGGGPRRGPENDHYPPSGPPPGKGYGYNDGPPPPPQDDFDGIRKGMSFDQVHQNLRRQPARHNNRDTDYGTATIEEYPEGDTILTVTYINGVVTKVSREDR